MLNTYFGRRASKMARLGCPRLQGYRSEASPRFLDSDICPNRRRSELVC